jgi:short-subunit dehydrogenase
MPVPVEGSSVVITGASSGIGRAAALSFAEAGADLVLAAREPRALEETAELCEKRGARVLAVPTDVADGEAVERLAAAAIERFGRIDTWVNNAGVMAYGTFDEIPAEVFERVIQTNLMGQIHGARAALPRFRRQGAGVLINLCSVWGRVTTPLVSPYVVSKHAVRAFSECLHSELVDEPDIHVATILPAAVDSPIFENSANYSGKRLRPVWPIFNPQYVADGIVACARSPKREVVYGRSGRALELLYTVFPWLYRRVAPAMFMRGTFIDEAEDESAGTVLEPREENHRIHGGWRSDRRGELAKAFVAALWGSLLGLVGKASKAKP